jgi:tRNA nucleotidyltransferase (CCA-adding enzyme)
MHAPVKGYMSKSLITAPPEMTVREIEELLFENNIGHLPIVEEDKLAGIVTRTDYLNFARTEKRRKREVLEDVGITAAETVSAY